jgi:hypothetical protein
MAKDAVPVVGDDELRFIETGMNRKIVFRRATPIGGMVGYAMSHLRARIDDIGNPVIVIERD